MKFKSILPFILVTCISGNWLTSCSEDTPPVPPIELKSICKIYDYEKVILVFNGDTLVPSVNLAISFPGEILPEEDVYEGKMMMETTALWPDKGYLFEKPSNLLFDLDVVSSPEQVTFTGTNNERYYKVDVSGMVKNDSVYLDMTYKTLNNSLQDKTFVLMMNADSYNLEGLGCNDPQDTIVWNGTVYPTKDFIRESLDMVFKDYVEKTGINAFRMTFQEDGRISIQAHDVISKTYIPMNGYYAYRFHLGYDGWGGGVLEIGMDEAIDFYLNFVDDFNKNPHFPNNLFQTYNRGRAYIPITLRSFYNHEGEEDLHLEMVSFIEHPAWNFSYFLQEITKSVTDRSEKTMRLRKINRLIYDKKINDEFLFYMKRVK